MREIKFRAWNGFTMISDNFCLTKEGEPFYFGTEMMGNIKVDVFIPYGKADLELMQYTGLKDKSGKEIYEGDILKNGSADSNSPKLITVVWNGQDGAFNGKVGVSRLPLSCAYWFYGNCEVIGNIYENPELLEV